MNIHYKHLRHSTLLYYIWTQGLTYILYIGEDLSQFPIHNLNFEFTEKRKTYILYIYV